jgi:NAD(P)-dependent dehydrogenase (short-subunit alcohol dehydrogenase family)
MTGRLAGKVIIVTGAGSGIGRDSAELFAREGARLVLADINADNGETVVQRIRKSGGEAIFVRVNVSVEADVENMVQQAVSTYGRLDGAFNNAGIGPMSNLIGDSSTDVWNQVVAINMTGTYLCVKHEVNALLKVGGGSIVNMASMAGVKGVPQMVAYSASKHGVIGITQTAAAEYARAGIRVNAICPGVVNTDANKAAGIDWNSIVPSPMGRVAEPAEIAELALWLLSNNSSYTTGQGFPIDGGAAATTFILPPL